MTLAEQNKHRLSDCSVLQVNVGDIYICVNLRLIYSLGAEFIVRERKANLQPKRNKNKCVCVCVLVTYLLTGRSFLFTCR